MTSDSEVIGKSARLYAPTVPAARKGGIRKADLEGDTKDYLEVLVAGSNAFLRGDTLHLYWDDPSLPIDTILIESPGDANFTLRAPVLDVKVAGVGLKEVWYERVSAFGDPVPIESPHAQVLVKTDVPGGDDPNPDTWPLNERMAPLQLPPGPIETPIPEQGVRIVAPVWDNMAAGDRLTLLWGGAPEHTFAPIEASQVGVPLDLMVPPSVVMEGGAGESIGVSYELRDVVQNYSGRAPSAYIEVIAGDAIYDAPTVVGLTSDNVLDFDALDGADLMVLVLANHDMAAGDDISLTFQGRSYGGAIVELTQTAPMTGTSLLFSLPNATVGQVVPGDASVFYHVESGATPKGRSFRTNFAIEGAVVPLPPPRVLEATDDATLDPGTVPNGATVEIALWPGVKPGDFVRLTWDGTAQDGTPVFHADSQQIDADNVTQPVRFTVPYSKVGPLAGGSVQVHYQVESGASERESEVLDLRVLVGVSLAPPIVEGELSGELNPELVPDGATVTIPAWPNMAINDRVEYFWIGESTGGHYTNSATVTTIGDVVVTVPRGVIEVNANGNDTVNVLYKVTYVTGGSAQSLARTFVVLPLPDFRFPAPEVLEAVGDTLNPDDVEGEATVVVSPYEGMAAGDIVEVRFGPGQGGGEHIERFQITGGDVNQPVTMHVPKANVEYFDGTTVTVNYTVLPFAGGSVDSQNLVLSVSTPLRWPAPYVEEAEDGDFLPEDGYPRGAHVVVRAYPEMQAQDRIDIYWGTGSRQFHDYFPISSPMDVRFTVPKDDVDQWIGEIVSVRYTVTRGTQIIHSEVLELRVALEIPALAPPIMKQVIEGKLNLTDLVDGADVTIPVYDDMEVGDVVHIDWDGGEGAGGITVTEPVSGGDVNRPIDSYFRLADIESYVDRTVTVHYRVVKPTGERISDSLAFDVVREAVTLPAPMVPAVQAGELDPRRVPNGAEVVVPYVADRMKPGDTIHMGWDCNIDDGDYGERKTITGADDIRFTVPFDKVKAGLNGTVVVYYQLLRAEAVIGVGTAVPFAIVSMPLPAAIVGEANGGNLDPDDVPASGATVVIDETAVFAAGDVVTLHWRGVTNYELAHTIQDAEAGKGIQLMIPKAYIEQSMGTVATLQYTILRKANDDLEDSPPSTYEVGKELGKGDLLVMGARTNRSAFRVNTKARFLRALSASTREDIVAAWRYEGDPVAQTSSTFRDTQPWKMLHVRTSDASTTLYPANIVGTETAAWLGTYSGYVGAFAALKSDGRLFSWGYSEAGQLPPHLEDIDGFVEIGATSTAFAGRTANGTVYPWGRATSGGAHSPLILNVRQSIGSERALAVVHQNGTLESRGDRYYGGLISDEAAQVDDAVALYSRKKGFVAMRANKHLVSWGVGTIPAEYRDQPFEDVLTSLSVVCGLRPNGSVVTWGSGYSGEMVPKEIADRRDIVELSCSTIGAFLVRSSDNRVYAWGFSSYGGYVPDSVRYMDDIVEVVATAGAFCVRRANGNIFAWGGKDYGGDFPTEYGTYDFLQVVAGAFAFAGLTRDGRVLTWGRPDHGGDSSMIALDGIRAVYPGSVALVAVRDEGGIVSWGRASSGGNFHSPTLVDSLFYETRGTALSSATSQGRALARFRARVPSLTSA